MGEPDPKAIEIEKMETDVLQHPGAATGEFQDYLKTIKPEEAKRIYDQVRNYDEEAHRESIIEMASSGTLAIKPLFEEPKTLTEYRSGSDEPDVREVTDTPGKFKEKTWSRGPHKGEKEREFEDGSKIHYTPDGQGGVIVESTKPARGNIGDWMMGTYEEASHATEHARPDGKGGVIVEHTDHVNHEDDYTAYFSGSRYALDVKIDWKNGKHLEQHHDNDGAVRTKMTGAKPEENFAAVERDDPHFAIKLSIRYADGSRYSEWRDGHTDTMAKTNGGWGWSISANNTTNILARSNVIHAYFLANSSAVADIMDAQKKE